MKNSTKLKILISGVVAFTLLFFIVANYPSGQKEMPPIGYSPIRDDALAARYLPSIYCPPEFGPIIAIYYRASKDESGALHIAYHPLWAKEWNDTKALGPFISRLVYTGGLSLQKAMYGKGDIESIAFAIAPSSGEVTEVDYETAEEYSPNKFGVKHARIQKNGPFAGTLSFRVISWNHLFTLEEDNALPLVTSGTNVPLKYFTSELWDEYSMWKNPETILRKNRAHFIWERGVSE